MPAFWTPLASQNFFWTWMCELKICIIPWSDCRTLVLLINSNYNAFTYWTLQLQSLQSWQVRDVLHLKTMSVCHNHGTGGRQMKYTEHQWDDNDGGKWSTKRKTGSSTTLLKTNSIQTGQGLNLASMVRPTILKIILCIKLIEKWNNALLKVPPRKLQIAHLFSVLYVLSFTVPKLTTSSSWDNSVKSLRRE